MPQRVKREKSEGLRRHPSWLTTDKHEIDLRRKRGRSDPLACKRVSDRHRYFTDYEVWRTDVDEPQLYMVELRSFAEPMNTCNCPDFQKNGLGTCKHIEHVIATTGTQPIKSKDSPFAELYIDHTQASLTPILRLPKYRNQELREALAPYLNAVAALKRPVDRTAAVLVRDYDQCPSGLTAGIRQRIRVSQSVRSYLEDREHEQRMQHLRRDYAEQLRNAAGKAQFLRMPLYDYQIDGMLHLAFTGRALLADEMGLGKTVQAIAAAHVLHDLYGVDHALVVCPASLKTEWEEQIAKFTSLTCQIVYGGRKERLEMYRNSQAFFLVTNYEQILRDQTEINDLLGPQLIILDEAQRIKNWKTKTARAIKYLNSRFAFVLTGTPMENRIDELYSLIDFADPTVFGSLFRFNRLFYNFDEDGKTAGFKNLRQLHEAAKGVMLRRRKDEIRDQLPERIDNSYFVQMTVEQKKRYEDHAYPASILMHKAQQRPLTPAEHDRLQMHLSCMRMLCDSVYILDQKVTASPKIDELIRVLSDIWEGEKSRKIVVFSEWVRMLDLVQEQLQKNGIGYAVHTGNVPQTKRREEINRFKNDPSCLVFLSTDSGGVGLNLQAASVIVNMDLPWNPARLEQRIARAWRKHQTQTVNVINLIAEKTIEQKMLATLGYKQGLADTVLDARGDFDQMALPDTRNQFIERLATVLETPLKQGTAATETPGMPTSLRPPHPSPVDILRDHVSVKLAGQLSFCSLSQPENMEEAATLFAVADNPASVRGSLEEAAGQVEEASGKHPEVIVIDETMNALLEKLAAAGIVTINRDAVSTLFETECFRQPARRESLRKRKQVEPLLDDAAKQYRLAEVLTMNDFHEEAAKPLKNATQLAGCALYVIAAETVPQAPPRDLTTSMIRSLSLLPDWPKEFAAFLKQSLGPTPPDEKALTLLDRLLAEANRQATVLAMAP